MAYTEVPLPSSYNQSPPPDDGTKSAANQIKYATTKTKLSDPLVTWIDEIQAQLVVTQVSIPIASVMPFAGTNVPAQWLFANGDEVSRATFADLFAEIGETYGAGDGSTTFLLPDMRGNVPAGKDDMGGVAADRLTNQSGGVDGVTLGAQGGDETHTLTEAELASHDHTSNADRLFGGAGVGPTIGHSVDVGNDGPGAIVTDIAGSDTPHNNVQPTLILNYIIYTGV